MILENGLGAVDLLSFVREGRKGWIKEVLQCSHDRK